MQQTATADLLALGYCQTTLPAWVGYSGEVEFAVETKVDKPICVLQAQNAFAGQ